MTCRRSTKHDANSYESNMCTKKVNHIYILCYDVVETLLNTTSCVFFLAKKVRES